MAQFNWIYLGDHGKRYKVGLFHGARTGHLMIYCNAKIVLIDFHVLQDKSYSFFIEEELCEVRVKREDDNRFSYDFHINKQADTPRNRIRKAREKKDLFQSLAFVGALVVCVVLFLAGFRAVNRNKIARERAVLLAERSEEEVARLLSSGTSGDVHYVFAANGRTWEAKTPLPETLALPLEPGDEFMVRYATLHPEINEIDFDRPTPRQINNFQDRTIARHTLLHPELRSGQVACQVNLAYELAGLSGLADLYYQDKAPSENPDHNQQTYYRLVRDVPFRQGVKERCW